MQLEDLLYYLHHPDKLDQLDGETLSSLVRKYPYIEALKSAYFKKFPGVNPGYEDMNEKLSNLVNASYSVGAGQHTLEPTVFDLEQAVSYESIPKEIHLPVVQITPEITEISELVHQPLYSYKESDFIRYLKSLPECTVPASDPKGQSSRPLADHHDETTIQVTRTEELIKSSLDLRESISSESLANLWLSQGKPELAIQIFEKLIAEFPEKSSIFAAKIEKLKAENSL